VWNAPFSPLALIKGKRVGFRNHRAVCPLISTLELVHRLNPRMVFPCNWREPQCCALISQSTITAYDQTCLAGLALSGVPLALNITCGNIPYRTRNFWLGSIFVQSNVFIWRSWPTFLQFFGFKAVISERMELDIQPLVDMSNIKYTYTNSAPQWNNLKQAIRGNRWPQTFRPVTECTVNCDRLWL